ncbi:hypothetical protein [Aeromicrobium sp. UC242_57]|uniref:hypothetical protein n=1 Tax=Aeromicrobium sp. UC242_57 TaxID=3374624 RepID=UPI0037B9434D
MTGFLARHTLGRELLLLAAAAAALVALTYALSPYRNYQPPPSRPMPARRLG